MSIHVVLHIHSLAIPTRLKPSQKAAVRRPQPAIHNGQHIIKYCEEIHKNDALREKNSP